MHNSRPACLVSTRSGHVSKSITPVRGSCSRRGAPRSTSGRRQRRSNPSSAITSAIPVRFSDIPSRREHQRDLVDRVTRRAQFNDPVVRAVLRGRALGSRA